MVKYDVLFHNDENMISYLQLHLLIKERHKIMKSKNFLIGLLMLAGVVVMFVAMPKQANASADGNVVEQYATTVASESNMNFKGNIAEENTNPFVSFVREIPGTTNWWHVLYNKWRRHGKR